MRAESNGCPQGLAASKRLEGTAALLAARVADLEARIRAGDESMWAVFLTTLNT
jgi:hypothetical protein